MAYQQAKVQIDYTTALFTTLAGAKTPTWSQATLREKAAAQLAVGQAEGLVRAGRALLTETLRGVWATVTGGAALGSAILVMLGPERHAQTHGHSISDGTTLTYHHYLDSTTVFQTLSFRCLLRRAAPPRFRASPPAHG